MIFIKDLNSQYVLINKRFEEVFGINSEASWAAPIKNFPPSSNRRKALCPTGSDAAARAAGGIREDSIEINGKNALFFHQPNSPPRPYQPGVRPLRHCDGHHRTHPAYEHALIDREESDRRPPRRSFFYGQYEPMKLRTPLNSILGFYLLEQTPANALQAEYVREILDSANSLLLLVNDLLDFSRIKAGLHGAGTCSVRTCAGSLQQKIEKYRPRAEEKGLHLRVRYPGRNGEPCWATSCG